MFPEDLVEFVKAVRKTVELGGDELVAVNLEAQELEKFIEELSPVAQRRTQLFAAHETAFNAAAECWEIDRDLYWESLSEMGVVYNLLVLLDDSTKSEVETLRLKLSKEVLKVEREMQRVDDRLAVTKGDPPALIQEAYTLGCKQLRLCDQLDALNKALRVTVSA